MLKQPLDRDSTYALDQANVYGSILALPQQLVHAQTLGRQLSLPANYRQVDRVIIAGMGGSALGARVIKAFGSSLLPLPLEIVTDFRLPSWADNKTLVILSSYSGNTEETLEVAAEVKRGKALPAVVSSGGELARLAKVNHWPALVFEPIHNPSNQPRMALGYSIGLILAILEAAGLVSLPHDEVDLITSTLAGHQAQLNREQATRDNAAKQLAKTLMGKAVIFIAGEHLVGAAHAVKNQFNENAKTFTALFDLPELDHHLLEGLARPKDFPGHAHFVLFDSPLYSTFISRRLDLVEEVIQKQGFGTTRIRTEAKRPLGQVFETIQFGAFVSLYLALLNKINPGPIPWVDYFKKKLA